MFIQVIVFNIGIMKVKNFFSIQTELELCITGYGAKTYIIAFTIVKCPAQLKSSLFGLNAD